MLQYEYCNVTNIKVYFNSESDNLNVNLSQKRCSISIFQNNVLIDKTFKHQMGTIKTCSVDVRIEFDANKMIVL